MALSPYVTASFGLKVESDSAGALKLFDRVREYTRTQLTTKNVTSGVLSVANGASDLAVAMGDIATGEILYLETDQIITVKLSGTGNTATTVRPRIGTSNGWLYLAGQFTSVHLANSSGSAAEVYYAIVGAE